jgi:hypothetical protein
MHTGRFLPAQRIRAAKIKVRVKNPSAAENVTVKKEARKVQCKYLVTIKFKLTPQHLQPLSPPLASSYITSPRKETPNIPNILVTIPPRGYVMVAQ